VVKRYTFLSWLVAWFYAEPLNQGEEENVSNDITRALIKSLPRLFIKYQSDQHRIAEVLIIPTFMNLDLYLEMRMIAVSFSRPSLYPPFLFF